MIKLPREDSEYWIFSRTDIYWMLNGIFKKNRLIKIFFDGNESFLTTITKISDDCIKFDAENFILNGPIAKSGFCFFDDDNIDTIFPIENIKIEVINNLKFFVIDFPKKIHKLQRREFFRIKVPSSDLKKCVVLNKDNNEVIFKMMDISFGGICLLLSQHDSNFISGNKIKNCYINIENSKEIIEFSLVVRYVGEKSNDSGYQKIGCQFDDMSNIDKILLNKLILKLQS